MRPWGLSWLDKGDDKYEGLRRFVVFGAAMYVLDVLSSTLAWLFTDLRRELLNLETLALYLETDFLLHLDSCREGCFLSIEADSGLYVCFSCYNTLAEVAI